MAELRDEGQDSPKEIQFLIEYYSTASGLLLGVIIAIYIPLILAPILIIRFSIATAGIMSALLLALAFGIYLFRGNPSRRKGLLSISPGDARIESSRRYAFVINSAGLTWTGKTMLKATQASLFETRIVFQKAEDCERARELIAKY